MDNILLILVFSPLVAGFLLLFLPNRVKFLGKALTLFISLAAFVLAVRVFALTRLKYEFSILRIGNFELDLLLASTPLSKFILMFAMGFGLLITL